MHSTQGRRYFLRLTATVGGGLALGGANLAAEEELRGGFSLDRPKEVVRIGFVGIGGRGGRLIELLLGLEGVRIPAVCDIIEDRVAWAQAAVVKAGQPKPTGYHRGETDFQRLCEQEQLDLVMTATPWKWHVPVCVAAMKGDKHAATEVPAAVTEDGCW